MFSFTSPCHSQVFTVSRRTCSPRASCNHLPGACVQLYVRDSAMWQQSAQAHRRHVVLHEALVVRHVLPGVRQRLRGKSSYCMLRQSKTADAGCPPFCDDK